jgi:GntR family transcriptional regulator
MHTIEQVLESLRLEASGVPIYVQLRDQFARAIQAGVLRPGDQMPTMRQVAVALRIDLNTVRHAYDELERAGALTLERGRGSFVAQSRPSDAESEGARLDSLAAQVLAMARAASVDPEMLGARVVAMAQMKETSS